MKKMYYDVYSPETLMKLYRFKVNDGITLKDIVMEIVIGERFIDLGQLHRILKTSTFTVTRKALKNIISENICWRELEADGTIQQESFPQCIAKLKDFRGNYLLDRKSNTAEGPKLIDMPLLVSNTCLEAETKRFDSFNGVCIKELQCPSQSRLKLMPRLANICTTRDIENNLSVRGGTVMFDFKRMFPITRRFTLRTSSDCKLPERLTFIKFQGSAKPPVYEYIDKTPHLTDSFRTRYDDINYDVDSEMEDSGENIWECSSESRSMSDSSEPLIDFSGSDDVCDTFKSIFTRGVAFQDYVVRIVKPIDPSLFVTSVAGRNEISNEEVLLVENAFDSKPSADVLSMCLEDLVLERKFATKLIKLITLKRQGNVRNIHADHCLG